MKIACPCGEIIIDQTDFLRDKARLIGDQDDEDHRLLHPWSGAALDLERMVWRCEGCGRLAIDFGGELAWFVPENERARGRVLQSAHGRAWRGMLRGRWVDRRGEVWWFTNVEDGFEMPETEAEVRRLYFEVLDRLGGAKLLRNAFLNVDGELVHRVDHEPKKADGTV